MASWRDQQLVWKNGTDARLQTLLGGADLPQPGEDKLTATP